MGVYLAVCLLKPWFSSHKESRGNRRQQELRSTSVFVRKRESGTAMQQHSQQGQKRDIIMIITLEPFNTGETSHGYLCYAVYYMTV